jgi:hypothetical protein
MTPPTVFSMSGGFFGMTRTVSLSAMFSVHGGLRFHQPGRTPITQPSKMGSRKQGENNNNY